MLFRKSVENKLNELFKELSYNLKSLDTNISISEKKIQNMYEQYLKIKATEEKKIKALRQEYKRLSTVKGKLGEEVLNVFKK